jgi:hypothetical protein
MTDGSLCPFRMLRRDLFDVTLNHLESGMLDERGVIECLKHCIEFYRGGGDDHTIRDFCLTKMNRVQHD